MKPPKIKKKINETRSQKKKNEWFPIKTILLAILAHILALKPLIFCNWFQKPFVYFGWFQHGFIETFLVSEWDFGPKMTKYEVLYSFISSKFQSKIQSHFQF